MIRHAPSIGIGLGLSLRGYGVASGFVLDQYPNAAVAYSPLALTSEHVSDLPTVYAQRDSDEALLAFTQQEIINGDIETWSQGGDVYVYTYYDQSGSGNNLTQATRSAQHKIVEGGVLVKQQESVACVSTGASYYLFDSNVSLTDEFSIFYTAEFGVGGNNNILGASANSPRLRSISTASQLEMVNDASTEINLVYPVTTERFRLSLIRGSDNSNSAYKFTAQSGSSIALGGSFTFTQAFARGTGTDSVDGKIQALIIYQSDQTTNLSGIDSALDRMLEKPKDIYIMLGQSNMVGRAVDGTSLTTRANDGNLLERRNIGGTNDFYGRFLDYYPSGALTDFGPNVGMARQLYVNGDRGINVLRFAIGGTSVASFLEESRRLLDPQTDLPPDDTDQWSAMVDYLNSGISLIERDACSTYRIKFVWYQGAEDANYTGSEGGYTQDLAGMYETHLTRLIEDLRANITGATSATPWFIIRSPDWNNNGQGGGVKNGQDEVRAAQVSIADADENAQWLTSDINQGITTTWEDASHIDAASQERLGIDLANMISPITQSTFPMELPLTLS